MVLSKMQDSSPAAPKPMDVVAFLKVYKALECGCCDQLIGFQHRVTGAIMCEPGCVGKGHTSGGPPAFHQQQGQMNTPIVNNTLTSPRTETYNVSPVRATVPAPRLEVTRVEKVNVNKERDAVNNRPVQPVHADTSAPAPSKRFESTGPTVARSSSKDEIAYKHVSSLHKYEEPVESPKVAVDTVDNRAFVKPTKSVTAPAAVNNKEGEQMRPAEAIRRDVNPFYRPMPSTKNNFASENVAVKNNVVAEEEELALTKPIRSAAPAQTEPLARTDRAPPRPSSSQPEAAKPKPAKNSWFSAHFSPSLLQNGIEVKTAFVWGLTNYQVQAVNDEEPLLEFQELLNTYAGQKKAMTRKPVKDEIVLGLYGDEYYRGRVQNIKEDGCDLVFIDFGDQAFNEFSKIIEPDDAILKYPVMSVNLSLAGVTKDHPKIKVPASLNELVFTTLQLELTEELVPNSNWEYQGKLWASSETTINSLVRELIKKTSTEN